jgi:hypothetical protein
MFNKKKILVYCDTGWAIGRIYKDLDNYLNNEFDITYCDWGQYDINCVKMLITSGYFDIYITNLVYLKCFYDLPDEHLKKFIFSCHGYQEALDLSNIKNLLPLNTNYSIVSKSVESFFPEPIKSKLYHTYNGVELSNFDYIKRNGELKNIGWCGGINIEYKRSKWCYEISEKTKLNLFLESNLTYDELRKWYSTIDILLINSGPNYFQETGPLPAFEAIASGVLVIGTSVGNFADVPGPKYSSIEEAIIIIEDLKKHPDKVRIISEEQYNCVKKNWSYYHLSRQWKYMFKNINNTIENSYFNNITIYSNTFQYNYSNDYSLQNDVNNIPRILHLIWVGNNEQPKYVMEHLLKWKTLMPNWQIILWTNEDLIEEKFPLNFLDLLNKVNSGAQKADILRYFIVEKYGGFYIDADIIPNKSLEPIIKQHYNTSLVICHDIELTWEYIINAFFAAVPNHPVLKRACEMCLNNLVINTEDIHMHSGPRLFGECIYLNQKSDIICIPSILFYHNLNFDNRFGMHMYAKNW